MLTIDLISQPNTIKSSFHDASVSYRPNNLPDAKYPDLRFNVQTFDRISRQASENEGRSIISPINLFFSELSERDEKRFYQYYRKMHTLIAEQRKLPHFTHTERNRFLQQMADLTTDTMLNMDIPKRLIAFAHTDNFEYPDLSDVGKAPHHSKAMTFEPEHYPFLTALSLFSKLMFPISGAYMAMLSDTDVNDYYREYFTYEIFDRVLDSPDFRPIYTKFLGYLHNEIAKGLKENDARATGTLNSDFILSRAKITIDTFQDVVGATVIVRKLVIYECAQTLKNGSLPNAMVYINRGIKETVDASLTSFRANVGELPRRDPPSRNEEDNTSLLDHSSKISTTTADVPVLVRVAAQMEVDRFLERAKIDRTLFETMVAYYERNVYVLGPIAISLCASFIGNALGGSRTHKYLPFKQINMFVVMTQIFLAEHGLTSLIPFMTCLKSEDDEERPSASIHSLRIKSSAKDSPEFLACMDIYKGYSEKTVVTYRRRGLKPKEDTLRIDFQNLIVRLVDWMTDEIHYTNVCPDLWRAFDITDIPINNQECPLVDSLATDLCRFYLMFHGKERPF